MKKIGYTVSALLTALLMIFSACGFNGQNNIQNLYNNASELGYGGTYEEFSQFIDNNAPKSAYDIAVENGFTGTEAEWLLSLRGKSAYEIAVDNGFSGTETEWLLSLRGIQGESGINGTDGTDGENGLSAYEIAVINGFSGTETEWLLSLRGIQGERGINGTDGTDGENGLSAYEIAVENGYSGTEAEWLLSLKGIQGERGINGTDGTDGENGLSAYEIAVENGYSGTEAEWLHSINNDISDIVLSVMPSVVEVNTENSRGSGIVITYDGYVLTNAHCITYLNETTNQTTVSTQIKCKFKGSAQEYSMTVVAYNTDKDMAIIKFVNTPQNLKPAALGNSDTVSAGDSAFVIGNALGYGLTVTAGHISDGAKTVTFEDNNNISYQVLLTDSAVNHGNSGGALFDAKGNVIGMITFKLMVNADVYAEGMSLALSINSVKAYIYTVNAPINLI